MVQATENADDSSDSSTENFKDVWTTPHENTVEVRDESLLDNAPNYLGSWVRYPKEIYLPNCGFSSSVVTFQDLHENLCLDQSFL